MNHHIKILRQEVCFQGFLKLVRYQLRHTLFGGGWSRILVRERLEGLRAAVVLLYDPWRDVVVLVEQFRIGLLEQGAAAWILEPVGGIVAPGDTPEATVEREAREEAGCAILALEPIGRCYVSPGFSDDRIRLFCGCVQAPPDGGLHGLEEEGEDIRVAVLAVEQALEELFSGRIGSAAAIIGLQWLAAHRARLRAAWRKPAASSWPPAV